MGRTRIQLPIELQEKLSKISNHMMKWSGEQTSFEKMYANYDREEASFKRSIGASNITNEIEDFYLKTEFDLQPLEKSDLKCLMSIEKFKEYVNDGFFINSDGMGYYATDKEKTSIPAKPSTFKKGKIRGEFTHVLWFNK